MMANYTMTIAEMTQNDITKQIFPEHYPFYVDDEHLKKAFEEKFINHYYYREIGYETPFIFKQRLESFLNLRMPYYEKLYETELEAKKINFMLNKDLKETFLREVDSENQSSGTTSGQQNSSGTNSVTQNGTSSNTHDESMIRDGVSASSLAEGYLTGTSSDNGTNTNTGSSESSDSLTSNGTSTQSGNEKSVEKTELISQGNIGITSSAQLLKEWREVILNIDELIIKDCSKLFMQIY